MAGFRRFRERYLPFWFEGSEVRALRNRLLRRVGLTRAREPERLEQDASLRYGSLLSLVAAAHVLEHGELRFLQIGAFDGVEGDEVLALVERLPVRGVLVEPQPPVFQRLRSLHGGRENLTLVNAAIDLQPGERPFYMAADRDVQFASFDKSHLMRHGLTASEIRSEPVRCLTVDGVLAEAGLDGVDLIQIDAEGYDYEILRSIDLDRSPPRMLRFEYRHFRESQLDECLADLGERGYRFLTEELDLIAIRDEAPAAAVILPIRPEQPAALRRAA